MSYKTYFVTNDIIASKGLRFANYIIDYVVILFVIFVLIMIIELISIQFNLTLEDTIDDISTMNKLQDYFFTAVFTIIYYFMAESLTYRTVGKLITGTIVVDEEGNRPTTGQILKRTFSRIIPFNQLSFIGEYSRGWHDSISYTYVVVLKKLEEDRNNFYAIENLGKMDDDVE